MSQRALCLAVRDRLWRAFGWDASLCDVTPLGRPKPMSGELFVGIYEGGVRNGAFESRDDYHSVNIVVTVRTPSVPWDAQGYELIHKAVTGLEVITEQIAAILHTDPPDPSDPTATWYPVLRAANAYILGATPPEFTVYGFDEPLRFRSISIAQERGGDWFAADPASRDTGQSKTIVMGDARRIQSNALQA